MREENNAIEYKSIQKIKTGDKGFRSLAETCVALANAQGGTILIGIDDKTKKVPNGQVVDDREINDTLKRLRSLCNNVAISMLYSDYGKTLAKVVGAPLEEIPAPKLVEYLYDMAMDVLKDKDDKFHIRSYFNV